MELTSTHLNTILGIKQPPNNETSTKSTRPTRKRFMRLPTSDDSSSLKESESPKKRPKIFEKMVREIQKQQLTEEQKTTNDSSKIIQNTQVHGDDESIINKFLEEKKQRVLKKINEMKRRQGIAILKQIAKEYNIQIQILDEDVSNQPSSLYEKKEEKSIITKTTQTDSTLSKSTLSSSKSSNLPSTSPPKLTSKLPPNSTVHQTTVEPKRIVTIHRKSFTTKAYLNEMKRNDDINRDEKRKIFTSQLRNENVERKITFTGPKKNLYKSL